MGAQDTGYNGPSVTFSVLSSGTQSTGVGPQGTLLLVGTAPQGTNQPKLFGSLAEATFEYGNFLQSQANANQQGFTLEPALELCYAQQGRFSNLQVMCVRAGASQAVVSINDTANPVGTAFALTATPKYAGSNTVTAVLSTSLYSLLLGANVQTLSLYDGPVGTDSVIETYSGTPTSIAQQVNQFSQIATCATDGKVGVAGTYTLIGAQTGLNAQPTDLINALNSALGQDIDFVTVLSGDTGVQAAVAAFVNNQAANNKPCEAFLGMAYSGLSYQTVINQAVSQQGLVAGANICFVANTGASRRNPVINLDQVYDGFYIAAVLAAIKSINNPAEPLTNKPITGFTRLIENFQQSDLVNLGRYGVMALTNQNGIKLFDGVTTANPGNFRRENINAQQNKLIKMLRDSANSLLGTATPSSNKLLIFQRVTDALINAVGLQIILGYTPNSLSVTPVANQVGRYAVSLSYNPRVEITEIDFSLALDFIL